MDWINLKRKLKVASNLFNHNYKNVVIEISIMVIVVSAIHPTNVQHMERYVLIYKLVISILKCHTIFCAEGQR